MPSAAFMIGALRVKLAVPFPLTDLVNALFHGHPIIKNQAQNYVYKWGWPGGAKVPGRPTNVNDSGARAYCTCSRRGYVLFYTFFLSSIFSLFFSLSLGDSPI